MTVELEAVIAALKAYRERVRGTPLKLAAVDRCIAIVKRLGKWGVTAKFPIFAETTDKFLRKVFLITSKTIARYLWCPGPESNRHTFRWGILRMKTSARIYLRWSLQVLAVIGFLQN